MVQKRLFLLVFALGTTAIGQSVPPGFKVEAYGGGLTNGTSLACAPDGRVFVGQLNGAVRIIKDGVLLETPFHTATVESPPGTDRGLLGLCLDPDFASNGYVYIYFTHPSPAPHNCVRRLKADPAGSDVSDGTETAIVDLEDLGADTMHNGGAIRFGADGKLYLGIGDNAVSDFAQSLASRFGKILRYNPDGSIPADNPTSFAGIAGSTSGEFQAIWAVGLRNPFRFAFQPGTGRLFINDVGVSTWEEIDEGGPGLNYGWQGGNTDGARGLPEFTDPIFQYGHSGAAPTGMAITGGVFYNPSTAQFPASFVGKYFFADYGAGFIYVLDPASPGSATEFLQGASGPVDLQVGADGALYYLNNGAAGGVYKVSYPVQTAPPVQDPGPVPPAPDPTPAPAPAPAKHKLSCGAVGLEPLLLLALWIALRRRRA